jgi:serine/threonine protein kinase
MEPERWQRIKTLLAENLDASPEERATCLERVRREDAALARQLEVFLNADEQKSAFLEEPLVRWQGTAQAIEPRRIGPYHVVRKLGQGGMGAVYLAVRADGEYDREVASKVVKRGMDTEEIIERFRAERQILATLSHPHIAQLHDGGTTTDGLPYFVMEDVKRGGLNLSK